MRWISLSKKPFDSGVVPLAYIVWSTMVPRIFPFLSRSVLRKRVSGVYSVWSRAQSGLVPLGTVTMSYHALIMPSIEPTSSGRGAMVGISIGLIAQLLLTVHMRIAADGSVVSPCLSTGVPDAPWCWAGWGGLSPWA